MPHFNDNLRTQFSEGKRHQKMLRSLRKIQNKHVIQVIYTNQRHLPAKVTPGIDFTDEPVI